MKSVGILTMHKVCNFGSALQAYATQSVITSLGYKCELIDYIYPNDFQFNRGYSKTFKNWKSKLSYTLGLHPRWKKMKAMKKFWPYLHTSKSFKNYEQIHKNPPVYDIYLTGSDQVWNPQFTKGDTTFFLDFAPKNAVKISYASSFASTELPVEFCSQIKPLLKSYQSISVRETNGIEIVKSLTGKVCPVTLDPTLLLNFTQWNDLGNVKRDDYTGKRYILLYVLDYALNPIPYIYDVAKNLQKQTGLEIITLGGVKLDFFKNIPVKTVWDADPFVFLHLIRNATYVVTSSFHGVAFAANYGKPLAAIIDREKGDDRISTLLQKLGMESCIFNINDPIELSNMYYNAVDEQEKLHELRIESIDYLKKSLG